jgi:hypothetical protein
LLAASPRLLSASFAFLTVFSFLGSAILLYAEGTAGAEQAPSSAHSVNPGEEKDDEGGWQVAYTVGQFLYSDPPRPDQIFKAYYRVINGTVEKLSVSNTIVSSDGNGTLEIMWPRNYPYTNAEGNAAPHPDENPVAFFNTKTYPGIAPVAHEATTDCFFVFSIPFSGSQSIGLAWSYLLTNLPYHGDEIPESCTPQTLVENVPTRKDGTITPLQQFKAGVAAEDTVCPPREQGEEPLMLLISPKGKPYCVKISNEGFMKRHGWTEPDTWFSSP